jgi:hypothetical protein
MGCVQNKVSCEIPSNYVEDLSGESVIEKKYGMQANSYCEKPTNNYCGKRAIIIKNDFEDSYKDVKFYL